MKKMLILMVMGCCFASFGTVIATLPNPGAPATTGPSEYPSTWGGLIYSNSARTTYRELPRDIRAFKVLGKVECSVSASNVMWLFSWGDTSFNALMQEVRKTYPEADDVVNMEIVAENYNCFIFYMKTTAVLRGIAVQYIKK